MVVCLLHMDIAAKWHLLERRQIIILHLGAHLRRLNGAVLRMDCQVIILAKPRRLSMPAGLMAQQALTFA